MPITVANIGGIRHAGRRPNREGQREIDDYIRNIEFDSLQLGGYEHAGTIMGGNQRRGDQYRFDIQGHFNRNGRRYTNIQIQHNINNGGTVACIFVDHNLFTENIADRRRVIAAVREQLNNSLNNTAMYQLTAE